MIEPTGYTALDLIGFTDRGTYDANVHYVKNDLVHYGGSIWKILIDDTIGITPAEGPNYTIFMGEPSNIVERIIAPLEDNPATVAYQTGRQIIYNDYLYEVIDDIAVGDTLITYEDDPTNANIKLAAPVETQVLALNTRLNVLQTEKNQVIIFGDSWTDYEHDTNVRIPMMIEDYFDVTVHNYSYGGTGFDVQNGYDQQITWFSADNINPNTIKFILISAGGNEYYAGTTATEFVSKFQDWYSKLQTALGGLYVPVYWVVSYSIANVYNITNPTTFLSQYGYYDSVRKSLHLPIKTCDDMGWVNGWRNDSHPDLTGHVSWGMNIINMINGTAPTIYRYQQIDGTINDANIPAGGHKTINALFHNEGGKMVCELDYSLGAMGVVANNTTVTFNKNLPVQIPNNTYLGEGCIVTNSTANGFTISVQNANARSWTLAMASRERKAFYMN